jgi:hypothetical protein
MARGRAKLTDKQEKILLQAQLMGLEAHDMTRIANRLVALKKEQEETERVNKDIDGYRWEKVIDDTSKDNKVWWKIFHPDGYVIEATNIKAKDRGWYADSYNVDFRITKPGTRYNTRVKKDQRVSVDRDWTKRLMPEQDKILYSIVRWCKYNNFGEGF